MSLEWKCLFRSCLDCFTVGLVRSRSCLIGVLVFNFKIFDLACGQFDKLAMFPNGGSPISVPANFWPSSGGNLSSGVGFTYASE